MPCLGRIEIDERSGRAQAVSMEDSTGCMHGLHGVKQPASDRLLSEPAIVAGIAKATLGSPGGRVPDHPVRSARGLCRWILPGMQPADSAVASREGEQGAGGEGDSGKDP